MLVMLSAMKKISLLQNTDFENKTLREAKLAYKNKLK